MAGGTSYGQFGSSGGGGSGTVSSVSVVSANGLAGTVANPTTTPALTLSTTITGMVKGNGASLLAAVAGTDYQAPITAANLTAGTGLSITGGTGATLVAASVSIASGFYLPTTTDQSNWNAKQAAGNYITALTGDITASGPGSVAATLATVNSNVGSFTNATLTVNAKGLITAASSGTAPVTSLSVASANGFTGSSSGGATPAITIATSVNGLVKGNGTALSAATAGTDYSAGTSALATGILKSTTTTGALTIAVAGDFPTLNQNTTGSAASFTGSLAGDVTGTQGATVLATVNSNVGSFTNASITVDAKGRITAASSGAGGGGSAMSVLTKTANYTIVTGDFNADARLMVEMNATSAATLTLPAASNSGYEVNVINIGSAIVTVSTAGSDTFGSTTDTTWTLIPGGSPQASNTFISNGGTRWSGF